MFTSVCLCSCGMFSVGWTTGSKSILCSRRQKNKKCVWFHVIYQEEMIRNTNFLILPPSCSIALALQEFLEDAGCFIWLMDNGVLMATGEKRPSILWMLFVFPFDSNQARNLASMSTLTLGVSCLPAVFMKFPIWHERAAILTVLTDSWYSAGF